MNRTRASAALRWLAAIGLLACAVTSSWAAGLEANEWKYRQPFTIDRAGVVKAALPPATLDVAQPGLGDLRLIDSAGNQVPYLIETSRPRSAPSVEPPSAFRVVLADATTQIWLETERDAPLSGVSIRTPASNFLKSARVELSSNGRDWHEVVSGVPIFRQFGAEELRIPFPPEPAAHVRITLDDSRSRSIPVTGASLAFSAVGDAGPVLPLPVRITSREEFARETLLTLDLGARHVPLAAIEVVTPAPLFARQVAVGVRELRGDVAVERTLFQGAIYRLAVDDFPARTQLMLPLDTTPPGRELLVHLHNGDSPPLPIEVVRAQQRPILLVFHAAAAGRFTLLSGNPDIGAPHYDFGAIADSLRQAAPSGLEFPPPSANPDYRRRDPLADTRLVGAELDPSEWKFRKPVRIASAGVQQLELDGDVLARTWSGLGDLRLVRDGAQVPYLLERPELSRAVDLTLTASNDPSQPRRSRWQLRLPRSRLPITRLTLTTTTPLFQRPMRLYETIEGARTGRRERTLASAEWRVTPGNGAPLVLALNAVPAGDTLMLETDNGDNPPIVLGGVTAIRPVARLLFKSEVGRVALYYGNPRAQAARYDIALVAPQMLAAEKHIATLGPEEEAPQGWAQGALRSARGGILFWGVLGVVVIALLVIVARLLPKPPAAP